MSPEPPVEGEGQVPYIEVKAFEHRINDQTARDLVERLTDALCEALGDEVREDTWVVVEGISPQRWGLGGRIG